MNFIDSVQEVQYKEAPSWFKNWENIGLIAWKDKNNDELIQYSSGDALDGVKPNFNNRRGLSGERLVNNNSDLSNSNEVYIDRDIMVLANPEIAQLPGWVIALVAAGALAAALSTAAGLLLVISASISHDLLKKTFMTQITEKQELFYARCSAAVAIFIAGLFGIYPPGFVAQVVAFAFGLAAATIFPALLMGIFYKRLNKEGAIAGMLSGLVITSAYIINYKFINVHLNSADNWFLGISPEGFGFIGMIVNFFVALSICYFFKKPPKSVDQMVDNIRNP
jgi:cation/acetate symporter